MSLQQRVFLVWVISLFNVSTRNVNRSINDVSVGIGNSLDSLQIRSILDAACVTGAVMGVEGHVWYTFLDRWLVQNTWRNVFKKMLLDQIIAAPIYTLTYIVGRIIRSLDHQYPFDRHRLLGTSLLEGRRSYEELKSDTQSSFLSLYLADCFVFMPIQIVNFKYIPAFYRVLFLSVVTFLFDAFISSYKHEHQDAHVDPK